MIRISFEAPTSHGLFIEIKNYCEAFTHLTAQGLQPDASENLVGPPGFEPGAEQSSTNARQATVPGVKESRKGPGRPKKSREEHLAPIEESLLEIDAQFPSEEVQEVIPPKKITKVDCVETLKKVSELPQGLNKVRDIFKKFGAERLSEINEKRYHELIKVAEQTLLEA